MQKWNKNLFFKHKPSFEVFEKAIFVMEKLGKLNTILAQTFTDKLVPTKIFAYIESKYSSRIEGVYTTLFDVVNTGIESQQQNLIKPLVRSLYSNSEIINFKKINEIEEVMNANISKTNRWNKEFGIYQNYNDKKIKIYEPPKNKNEVSSLLEEVILKSKNDKNIVDMLLSHILFEKIHPFVDANGRIGRLILQRSISRTMNFVSVIPLSWAFLKRTDKYYEAFDIKDNDDINQGIIKLLDTILLMCETIEKFLVEINIFKDKYIEKVKSVSYKVTDAIAELILLNLQTKSAFLQKIFKLNSRTVDSIFKKLEELDINFNIKIVNRKKVYWNVNLETIIDKYFN